MRIVLLVIVIIFLFPAIVFAQESEFIISFDLSNKKISLLTDNKISTHISFPPKEHIRISCIGYSAIMLKWYEPAAYRIELFDSGGEIISLNNYDNNILNQYIDLQDSAEIDIYLPSGGILSDIVAFRAGEEDMDTQIWEEPYDKADILVISSHADDEYLYMGGTIPYYGTEKGLHVSVAWMSHQKRLRQDEALAALWAMGVNHYPEFIGFPDRLSKTYKNGAKIWGGEDAVLGAIVELYRKYKPEVVVTHDLKGEYGHGAHMVTAAMSLKAADAAADETQFVESVHQYGTWQIKKLYLHLYKENKIVMDWNQPLEAFEGKTALDMAKLGYSYHKSQHVWNFRVSDTSKYSCAKFGLAFTTVGYDDEKNDFLENIPLTSLSDYVPPEPEPTAESTIEPTIDEVKTENEPEQELIPVDSTEPVKPTTSEQSGNTYKTLIIVAGVILIVTLLVFTWLILKRKFNNPR